MKERNSGKFDSGWLENLLPENINLYSDLKMKKKKKWKISDMSPTYPELRLSHYF